MYTLIQQASTRPYYVRRIRVALLCFSVGANALCAGGVFCFPIISPALATHLKFTQPQLTTIAMVGLMGQYPLGALVGKILDHYGAWACSLIAACLFSAGFGLFANEISMSPPDTMAQPSVYAFHRLVIYFFICGVGITFSYFASVFAASKNFPNHIGMASGASTALFGLSPTFLSILASRYFSSSDGQVNATHFLQFIAILSGCLHLIGGLTMHIIPPEEEFASPTLTTDPEVPDERTALLPNKSNGNENEHQQVRVDVVSVSDEYPEFKYNALSVLSDRNFLALSFIMFLILGSCEMVISNIGTIVLSLPNETSFTAFAEIPSPVDVTATQVRMLSIANTLSRLLIGPLADFVSPVPSRNRGPGFKKHRISRLVFLAFSAAILVCTYTWMVVGIKDQASIWLLSVGAGIAYGCAFTTFPSIVSSIWGLPNSARNFGIMTYATLIGTPAFSYLYAFVTAAHVDSGSSLDETCYGPACWRLTFEVSALCAALALGISAYLWRLWRGRL